MTIDRTANSPGLCDQTKKRCYQSKEQARRGMSSLSARLRVYKCPHCKFWHLTKDKMYTGKRVAKKEKRKKRARVGRKFSLLPENFFKNIDKKGEKE